MTATTKQNLRVEELLAYIRDGRIMDAMREFYADDIVMEEPAYGSTVGLAANLEREQKFVESVAEFRSFETPAVMIGEDSTSYTNVMRWLTTDGQEVQVEQVAVQRWRDGKIVHERFYYDRGS